MICRVLVVFSLICLLSGCIELDPLTRNCAWTSRYTKIVSIDGTGIGGFFANISWEVRDDQTIATFKDGILLSFSDTALRDWSAVPHDIDIADAEEIEPGVLKQPRFHTTLIATERIRSNARRAFGKSKKSPHCVQVHELILSAEAVSPFEGLLTSPPLQAN